MGNRVTVLLLLVLVASFTPAAARDGWRVDLFAGSGQASVAGIDEGGGYSRCMSGPIGIGDNPPEYDQWVERGACTTFTKNVYIWGVSQLSWRTCRWDTSYIGWRPDPIDCQANVYGFLYRPDGSLVKRIHFNLESVGSVPLINTGTDSYRLQIVANPVPEPSSLLALGSGLLVCAGFVRRRRR